jgi:ribosomal protein L37AE/L43A
MPEKPTKSEEEYFAKLEAEKLEKRRKEAAERKAAEEREARKKLHYMHCPKCGADLKEERYQGIAIDRCTECKGIWFDAGEAESLLEKELNAVQGFFSDLFRGFGSKSRQ